MKQLCTYLLLLISFLFTWQETAAAPLRAQIPETEEGFRYKALSTLPIEDLYQKAELANKNKDALDSVPIYLTLGIIKYYAEGERERDRTVCIKSCNLLGSYYLYESYDYQNAYRYLRMAQDLLSKNKDRGEEFNVLTNLAFLHHICASLTEDPSQREKAVNLYSSIMRNSVEKREWRRAATTFINFCSIALYNDSISVDRDMRTQASKIPAGEPLASFANDYGNAVAAFKAGDYKRALSYFDDIIADEGRKSHGKRFRMLATVNKFHTFLKMGATDSITKYIKVCTDLATSTEQPDFLFTIYDHYANYLKEKGDSTGYRLYKLKAYETENALKQENSMYRANRLESQVMMDVINNFLINKRLNQRQIVFIIIIAVLLLILASYYLYSYRKTKSRLEHLYKATREMADKKKPEASLPRADSQEERREEKRHEELYREVLRTLDNTEEAFAPDFTVTRLAQLMGEKARSVSKAISENGESNFTTLLTRVRIMEACRRMEDKDKYGNLTIEAISHSVGFKSRTNFSTAFKRETGMTPSEYIRMSRQQK